MAAQDVDTRAKAEIEAAAMNVLTEVLGADKDMLGAWGGEECHTIKVKESQLKLLK